MITGLSRNSSAQRLGHVEERLEADTSTVELFLERLDELEATIGEEFLSLSIVGIGGLDSVEALGIPGVGASSPVKRTSGSLSALPSLGVVSLSLNEGSFVSGSALAISRLSGAHSLVNKLSVVRSNGGSTLLTQSLLDGLGVVSANNSGTEGKSQNSSDEVKEGIGDSEAADFAALDEETKDGKN